jgi:hypothetical protein
MSVDLDNLDSFSLDSMERYAEYDLSLGKQDMGLEKSIFAYSYPGSTCRFASTDRIGAAVTSETDAKMEMVSKSCYIAVQPLEIGGKIEAEWKWGGDDGPSFEIKASGKASDEKGNSASVSISRDSDGETKVGVSVEAKKE